MNRLGKLVYTNAWGYEVYASAMRDMNSTRVSLAMYVVSPQGEMSDIFTVSKKDIFNKKSTFHFFYDIEGDFGRDDIDKIKNAVLEVVKDEKSRIITQERATMSELHSAVCDYIRENAEDLEDNESADVFIRDGYGYMRTECMDLFIKGNKQLGYSKRVEVLKRLKIMGALATGNNRPYDILVSVGGTKKHFYKVVLTDCVAEEVEEAI